MILRKFILCLKYCLSKIKDKYTFKRFTYMNVLIKLFKYFKFYFKNFI